MAFATRDFFVTPSKRRYAEVDVGDGQLVRIRSLTEREWSKFTAPIMTRDGKLSQPAIESQKRRLLVLCVVDEDGNQILTSEDTRALEELDGSIVNTIYDAARKHCGFEMTAAEEAEKN